MFPVKPSKDLMMTIPKIITDWDFPQLKGITETPTLRADHSLLDASGYDPQSGLFYDPGRAVFPAIPDKPTKVDSYHALELFTGERGILKDFPFTRYYGANAPVLWRKRRFGRLESSADGWKFDAAAGVCAIIPRLPMVPLNRKV